MASSHSDAAKLEQIVTGFYAKSLHIILESRSPYVSSRYFSGEQAVSSPASSCPSPSSVRSRDKWFNLAIRECPAALGSIDIWRRSYLEPMVVDVVLVKQTIDWDPLNFSPGKELGRNLSLKEHYPFACNSDQEELAYQVKSEKIIERWIVQHENRKNRDCSSGSRRSSSNNLSTTYKKFILLLRSLYSTLRLLPAYKIFRDLNSSCQLHEFKLAHRVSSIAEHFTPREEAEMQQFVFTPVDTSCGRLCVSVMYRPSISDLSSEPSTPMSPQLIPDYVGSPLADPLKRFPSLPTTGVNRGSPSSLPFSRRHSWSYDQLKASPSSVSVSPSPTHSESHASISNPFSPMNLRSHPQETSLASKRDICSDEYCPSPGISPSPTPSPPIHIPRTWLSRALLRCESAPVRIPGPKAVSSPALSNKCNIPPSPPIKGLRSGNCATDNNMGPSPSGAMVGKSLSLGKDDARKYSGVKLPNITTRTSSARSSSRPFQDDYDEPDFACPFDVDEDDLADPSSRKSQDAAVGALVQMLKNAPPLHLGRSVNPTPDPSPAKWRSVEEPDQTSESPIIHHTTSTSFVSPGPVASKTTTDALEELQAFVRTKDLMLHQRLSPHSQTNYTSAGEPSV